MYLQFEALKKKLYQEGLFDSKYKKDIPLYPGKIAVLSAYPSAALMDVMQTIKSRFPICRVIIFPIPVQGKDAYLYIVKTLKYVDQLKFNTIILARGGGSLEHLWNFNEETLARTIFELKTPIITGVGHETDFTICDYVSDFRALTPTAAAIKATPNLLEMQDNLMQLTNLLKANMKYKIESSKKELIRYENYYLFHNPEKIYGDSAQYLNHLQERLINGMKNRLQTSKTKQKELSLVLSSRNEIFNEYGT
ncbi:MAG: exodeoxyribonuclease VII large subunit [Coprobacillus sp. 28_7]|nr:MAG: exodeoxyribonuclease VII large subunit [Coprobacillus sp. 28_7]